MEEEEEEEERPQPRKSGPSRDDLQGREAAKGSVEAPLTRAPAASQPPMGEDARRAALLRPCGACVLHRPQPMFFLAGTAGGAPLLAPPAGRAGRASTGYGHAAPNGVRTLAPPPSPPPPQVEGAATAGAAVWLAEEAVRPRAAPLPRRAAVVRGRVPGCGLVSNEMPEGPLARSEEYRGARAGVRAHL